MRLATQIVATGGTGPAESRESKRSPRTRQVDRTRDDETDRDRERQRLGTEVKDIGEVQEGQR